MQTVVQAVTTRVGGGVEVGKEVEATTGAMMGGEVEAGEEVGVMGVMGDGVGMSAGLVAGGGESEP